MEKITDYEIRNILRNEEKLNQKILNQVVERKIVETAKERFTIQELYAYSIDFKISMTQLMLNVLRVEIEDYFKFLRGEIKQVSSKQFHTEKEKRINQKRTMLKKELNQNRKIYFNNERIQKEAKKCKINELDFTLKVLGKSKACAYRVLKDKKGKKRLSVGKYINTALPEKYLKQNIEIIRPILGKAIRKASYKIGRKLSKEDYEEEVQKALIYIHYQGNHLDKYNKLVIKSEQYQEKHAGIFYQKAFFYVLSELSKKQKEELEYNDNRKYANKPIEEQKQTISRIIEDLSLNDFQKRIIIKKLEGFQDAEIVSQEKINQEEYQKEIKQIQEIIKKYYHNH